MLLRFQIYKFSKAFASGPERTHLSRKLFESIATFVAPIAVAITGVWPLLIQHGVPAFQHDWIWPAARGQVFDFALSAMHAWQPSALGAPQSYPSPWLPYVVAATICFFVGTRLGLVLLLAALFVLSYFSCRQCLRGQGLTPNAAAAGALFFEASPMVLNLVHAGHWIELWSYALVPFVLARMLEPSKSWRGSITNGIMLGVASAQLQYFIFALFLVLILAKGRWTRFHTFASVVAIVFLFPTIILGIAEPTDPSLDLFRPYPEWARSQAASFGCAIRSLCYIGGYDRRLAAAVQWALFVPPMLGVVALVRFRMRTALALCVVLIGALLSSGVDSPLAAFWYWAYANVPVASMFRENYHFNFLTEFGSAFVIALSCDVFAKSARLVRGVLFGFVATLVCALSSQLSAGVPSYDLHTAAAALGSIGGRYAIYPGVPTWKIDDQSNHGYIPLLLPSGNAYPVNSIPLKFPIAAAFAAARECRLSDAERLLSRAGVRRIVTVPHLESAFTDALPPDLKVLARPLDKISCTPSDPLPAQRLDSISGSDGFGIRLDTDEVTIDAFGHERDLLAVSQTTSPSIGWARVALWPTLPYWTFLQRGGIFTFIRALSLPIAASYVIAGSVNGNTTSSACTKLRALDAYFTLFKCVANPAFDGTPPIVVARAFVEKPTWPTPATTRRTARVDILSESPEEIKARLDHHGSILIILRDQFDPQWRIDTKAIHVRLDEFYNGWLLPPGPSQTIRVDYEPTALFRICLLISMVMAVLGIARLFGLVIAGR